MHIVATSTDAIRIKCNATDESWTLSCVADTWVGLIGNCTLSEYSHPASRHLVQSSAWSTLQTGHVFLNENEQFAEICRTVTKWNFGAMLYTVWLFCSFCFHRYFFVVLCVRQRYTSINWPFSGDYFRLAEMLEVLVLGMTIMQEEAAVFGLRINWSKTKILQVPPSMPCSTVQVADGHVEMVNAFVCLGSMIHSSGGSRDEVLRRIGIARSCMNLLEKRIWKSSIRLDTKIRLYQTYIVPVLLYGCETWSTTKLQCSRIDVFDMWALRKILRITYTRHMTNVEVRTTTTLSHLVTDRRLRLFGHIARSSPQEDHHCAVAAVIRGLAPDWKRPLGRPSHTWLRAMEANLGQQNIGLASAWRKAAIRDDWRRIVDTTTLQRSTL